jgi:tripartite-type tricarboxylate transporter receptor subunit TctC
LPHRPRDTAARGSCPTEEFPVLPIRSLLAAACLALTASLACAQTFPTKPVRIVVPYPAGGAVDNIVRAVAERLRDRWSTIVIENKGGGGTQIGTEYVGRAEPDGHTLLATGMETFAISPFMNAKLSYDPAAFIPVSGLGYSDQLLIVPANSPFKSVADVIAAAKKDNGALQYGTVGMGGSSHINMVLFESMAGVKLTPVHYRGGAPLVTDLLGGHVPMAFLSVQLGQQGMAAGLLRPLAFSTKARSPRFPDVPTIDESGVKGFEAVSWYGVFAPAGTPKEIVAAINADLQKVWASAEFQESVVNPRMLGTIAGGPDEFAAFVKAESDKWKKVVEGAGLKIQ